MRIQYACRRRTGIKHRMRTSIAGTLAVLPLLTGLAGTAAGADQGVTTSDAIAVLSTPALSPGFPHFPFVNPNAPKGGTVTLGAVGSFDSFNPFILRGTSVEGMVDPWVAMPGGSEPGSTIGHVWESVMTPSPNEIATAYCHICKTVEMLREDA